MITLTINNRELDFEHSLISLSKWEAEFEKPWFSTRKDTQHTESEILKYFEYMYLGPNKYRHLLSLLTREQALNLIEYINKKSTATTIRKLPQKPGPKENITSELIYYWLTAFRIPFSPTETWHLNRLLMLVEVCSAKQAPPQKSRQSKSQQAMDMRALNEQRRKMYGTSG